MRKRYFSDVVACTGAMIGAGFASGREVIAFFTRYGVHGWWLIVLSSGTMAFLCALCLQHAAKHPEHNGWYTLFGPAARMCTLMLMLLTGGAMLSAAGHMIAMVWSNRQAYFIGLLGTLTAAWMLSFGSLRPLSWLSGILTTVLLGMTIGLLLMKAPAEPSQAVVQDTHLMLAALQSVAYASMNMTLALGVVCRCARTDAQKNITLSAGFGCLMGLLLGCAHLLYVRNQQLLEETFPIVRLLSHFGRSGYLLSTGVLYLSIFTTLVSIVLAIREAMAKLFVRRAAANAFMMTVLVGISSVGFTGIVDRMYAPAGLLCLILVFIPVCFRRLDKVRINALPSKIAE